MNDTNMQKTSFLDAVDIVCLDCAFTDICDECPVRKTVDLQNIKEVFLASDGSKHTSADKCAEHEAHLQWINRYLELKKFELPCNRKPFDGCEHYDDSNYYWYKVWNDGDLNLINEAFQTEQYHTEYPVYICIESDNPIVAEEVPRGDCYATNLSKCVEHAKLVTSELGCTLMFFENPLALIIDEYECDLKSQLTRVHYRTTKETARHELYGFICALKALGLIESEECYVDKKRFEDA